MTNPPVFLLKTGGFGPSSATRTRGLMLPKHPPYQLGYTRIQDIKFYQMWSNMWSEEFYHKLPELSRGEMGDIYGDSGLVPIFLEQWRKRSPGSQIKRPTNWATPGYWIWSRKIDSDSCGQNCGQTAVLTFFNKYAKRKSASATTDIRVGRGTIEQID